MVVDEALNFLSQRRAPKLATVVPTLTSATSLTVTQQGNTSHLQLDFSQQNLSDLPTQTVTVWGDKCTAVDLGDEAAAWFSQAIQHTNARLVRLSEHFHRPVDPKFTRGSGHETGFADGFPFLLTSEESLTKLNGELAANGQTRVPMNRFRPNIVVKGCQEPWEEDSWSEIRVMPAGEGGSSTFQVCKICERCKQTRVNQISGATHPSEPSATLLRIRPDHKVPVFGQNMVPILTVGSIAVGDKVDVVARKNSPLSTVKRLF